MQGREGGGAGALMWVVHSRRKLLEVLSVGLVERERAAGVTGRQLCLPLFRNTLLQ